MGFDMDNKLPLDSARWRELQSTTVTSADLPKLIRQIQIQKRLSNSKPFVKLIDRIIHQFDCCEATYAVVPYLVEIGDGLLLEERLEIWNWVGTIAATYDVSEDPAPEDLLPTFQSALQVAEVGCIDTLIGKNWDLEDSYNLSVDAFGLAGHALGKLTMDKMVAYDDAESAARCPNCSEEVEVAVFDAGLVVVGEGNSSDPAPPNPERLLANPTAFEVATRSPNPWASIGNALRTLAQQAIDRPSVLAHLEAAASVAEGGLTPDVKAGPAFSLLGGLIMLKGFPEPAMRYFHAWDRISCPYCESEFVFADHWWGLQG